MEGQDYLVRAIARETNIRALACISTGLVHEACLRHQTSPTASAALGRALTGGTLMGALLKTGQRVGIRFDGDGPIGKIIVEADSNGEVRGYVSNPSVELKLRHGKLDVARAVGKSGTLEVIKDLGLKEPYRGMVPIYTGEIAEDLAYYFAESEQIPSAVGLGVFVNMEGQVRAAGGFLVQSFPPRNEDIIERLIDRIGNMTSVTDLLREGKRPEDILATIFEGIPYDLLEKREIAYKCNCSRERVEAALISLGPEEISNLLMEKGGVDVKCEFCRAVYEFSTEDLNRILLEIRSPRH